MGIAPHFPLRRIVLELFLFVNETSQALGIPRLLASAVRGIMRAVQVSSCLRPGLGHHAGRIKERI
jgi:hypothetical protein